MSPKEKRFTAIEMLKMAKYQYRMLSDCIRYGTFRLLGIHYTEFISVSTDDKTGDLVIKYL